eukprot:TRINITY_DN49637_c0_g1_i1.p2 TRINITY_DN49637_c0_g1~~TRINITY_DN49637_c0_g1_i1.p2  ORF type:complete len:131 (+),score=21.56 TRINITY_DN49637_c0_g1_i1:23-394(+)
MADRETQLEAQLQKKEQELEERGKLLMKTKVAITQLQQELANSRQIEEDIRAEAERIEDECRQEIEQQQQRVSELEQDLESRDDIIDSLKARVQELEYDADAAKEDAQSNVHESGTRAGFRTS